MQHQNKAMSKPHRMRLVILTKHLIDIRGTRTYAQYKHCSDMAYSDYNLPLSPYCQ